MPETYDVDTHYVFDPEVQPFDELVFTGYKRNQISWKIPEQKWVLLDRTHLGSEIGYHRVLQEVVLVGLFDWNVYPLDMSRTKKEEKMSLKFSQV